MNAPFSGLAPGVRYRQRGLTIPEVMLALSLLAIGVAGSLLAYNNIEPRVRSSHIMGELYPVLGDLSQFAAQTYRPRPFGLTGAAAETISATSAGWGPGTPSNTTMPLTCGTAPINTVGTCSSAPGCTWVAGTCGGVFSAGNPNFVRVGNIPRVQLSDGAYDLDADAEWHLPIGDNAAIDFAFALAPASNEPFGSGNGNFVQCGDFSDQAVMFIMAVESAPVCENLWSSINGMPTVSAAWCEVDFVFPAGTNPDGEAAVLGCFRSR